MKTKPVTPKNMHSLALKLIDFLNERNLYGDAIIYVGINLKIQKDRPETDAREITTPKGLTVFESDFFDDIPTEYHNPKTLTVTFEDDLYFAMNEFGRLHDELNTLSKTYGLYLEMGHPWNFSLYPNK